MANLRVAELDFDAIKTNLKTFLQAQDEFSDYDFEGSSLSVLIDLLAYNTHYNAYLANMLMNEMFLDSAVKRSSAVSIAKHLGYTPRSVRSSVANLDILVTNPTGLPPSISMNRFTQFSSTINGTSYTFSTIRDHVAVRNGTTYSFENIDVVEGVVTSFTFVVADISPDGKYEIPAVDVDTSSLFVTVQNSVSDITLSTYSLATDITGVTSTSKVYFLEQNPLGKYQIYFGDGIIGKQLSLGNIVTVTYLRSSGAVTNVSSTNTQTFSPVSSIAGSSNISITVNSNSTGAKDAETINSIKFNAPKVNAAKNRAVTSEDYEALILANYSGAESISVWGGEDNDPPIYGKVLVSLKPASGFSISQSTKDYIRNTILNSKKMVTVEVDFIDPSYIFLSSTSTVEYNSSLTTLSADAIKTQITNAVSSYFSNELNQFDKKFYYSQLLKVILDSNSAIVNAVLTIKLQKRLDPVLGSNNVFTSTNSIKFRNPIKPGGLTSSFFFVTSGGASLLCKLVDIPNDSPPINTGQGSIRLLNALNNNIVTRNIGTVNYSTGEVVISGITPTSYPTGIEDIRINVEIQESFYNLSLAKNELFVKDDTAANTSGGYFEGTSINVVPVI